MRRRKAEEPDPCRGLRREYDRAQARVDAFEDGIEALMKPHRPYIDEWGIRPGNSHDSVSFWCEKCRAAWPCRTFNDLRALYGGVNGWENATRPYEPLKLHLAAPPAGPAHGAGETRGGR